MHGISHLLALWCKYTSLEKLLVHSVLKPRVFLTRSQLERTTGSSVKTTLLRWAKAKQRSGKHLDAGITFRILLWLADGWSACKYWMRDNVQVNKNVLGMSSESQQFSWNVIGLFKSLWELSKILLAFNQQFFYRISLIEGSTKKWVRISKPVADKTSQRARQTTTRRRPRPRPAPTPPPPAPKPKQIQRKPAPSKKKFLHYKFLV